MKFTRQELSTELQIELDESEDETEMVADDVEPIPAKGTVAKKPRLSKYQAQNTEKGKKKPKAKSNERKKSDDKENQSPKKKKSREAEKPKTRKKYVYYI